MPLGSPNLARREQAIEATRRRLRRLEIETHRIKAELARLEADYEDDVADWLSGKKIRPRLFSATEVASTSSEGSVKGDKLGTRSLSYSAIKHRAPANRHREHPHRTSFAVPANAGNGETDRTNPKLPTIAAESAATGLRPHPQRKNSSPLLLSLAVHMLALGLCLSFTFVTLVQQPAPLLASPNALDDETAAEISEVETPPTKFDDVELQNVVLAEDQLNIADNLLYEFDPAEVGSGIQPLGDIGQLDALPSDVGTLMAGAGSPAAGKPAGPLGEAVFFGARSQGDRFVFVVDNSSSMKGGRLEMATAELLRAVDVLSPRQNFYVIFVSDQTYPMFYPLAAPEMIPATPANKKRLADWLPKAILASGKNRELIKAMDLAASLQPHAVFLLWDGDLKYSDKVRTDVMTHLARPNQWNFAVHTLGMGVTSLDAEFNLMSIAQAHGGTFRRIDVPTNRGR